jgi:hypothetical protein
MCGTTHALFNKQLIEIHGVRLQRITLIQWLIGLIKKEKVLLIKVS